LSPIVITCAVLKTICINLHKPENRVCRQNCHAAWIRSVLKTCGG
jgi:hypothetical protein